MMPEVMLGKRGSNVYLILDEKNVLIDAGADERELTSFLMSLGPRRIDLVLLTHVHLDHILALPKILEYLDQSDYPIDIAVHEAEIDHINDKDYTAAYLFGINDLPEVKPTISLKDGNQIDIGNNSLEIIHTPGHSIGSICIYDKKNKNLFSGDTVFSDGNFGRTDLFGGSSSDLISSIERLTRLDVENIYPGHMSPVLGDGNKSIGYSLKYAKMLLF
ncbi:MAG TPA: MBL fold metallo-hydrolase [Halobacteria archaeon]|nr:MBL fold metallo-hydrolase [Halobacteria archaeon]